MLEGLCGNKTVQKILLFLFVNHKCYGTQLKRSLKTALTPIQKGLLRLEHGGLIESYYEGKTRIYRFNPAYPLLEELEQLLKKAYTLLPSHEKKEYYLIKETQGENRLRTLLLFWKRLSEVKKLTFKARTKSKEELGWNGQGNGEVEILKNENEHQTLIFNEKGSWQGKQQDELSFSNVFRWTLDRNACVIALEHLRHGMGNPVFLFHLAPSGKNSLASIDSHLCGGDCYFGQILLDRYALRLNWRIIGPKKNVEIDYHYV